MRGMSLTSKTHFVLGLGLGLLLGLYIGSSMSFDVHHQVEIKCIENDRVRVALFSRVMK